MEQFLENNIIHKLNQMLLIIANKNSVAFKSSFAKCSSNHIDYFLSFPSDVREEMSQVLDISPKTLHRIFENPKKILDDYELMLKFSAFFEKSYPEMICILFNVKPQSFEIESSSVFLKEIIQLEKELSIEARRELIRLLILIRKMNISIENFSFICRKMLNKKCFTSESFSRILNLIDNF